LSLPLSLSALAPPPHLPSSPTRRSSDLHHSETALLPRELQTYPAEYWEKRVAGPGAMLLYLGVEGELPQLEHHTLLFARDWREKDRKSTRLNSSHVKISYAVFCLKKKKT